MAEVESIVRRARVGRWLLVAVVAATCLGTLYAIAVNVNQGSDITNVHNDVTKIEHTACAKFAQHPGNLKAATQCAALRAQIARSEPIENPCTSFQRVTGERGRNCGRYYVNVDRGGEPEPIETPGVQPTSTSAGSAPATRGGHAVQAPSQGTQHPSPQGGGGAPTGSPAGGNEQPDQGSGGSEPGSSGSDTSTSSTSSTTQESTATTEVTTAPADDPVKEAVGTVVNGGGEVVTEAGKGVSNTLETVNGAACALTHSC